MREPGLPTRAETDPKGVASYERDLEDITPAGEGPQYLWLTGLNAPNGASSQALTLDHFPQVALTAPSSLVPSAL